MHQAAANESRRRPTANCTCGDSRHLENPPSQVQFAVPSRPHTRPFFDQIQEVARRSCEKKKKAEKKKKKKKKEKKKKKGPICAPYRQLCLVSFPSVYSVLKPKNLMTLAMHVPINLYYRFRVLPLICFPPSLLMSTYVYLLPPQCLVQSHAGFLPSSKSQAKPSKAKSSGAKQSQQNNSKKIKSNQIKKRKNSINRLEFSAITAPFKSVIRHLLPAPPQGKWTSANPAKHEIQRYPQVNIWIGLEKTLRFYISRYLILQTNFFSFFFSSSNSIFFFVWQSCTRVALSRFFLPSSSFSWMFALRFRHDLPDVMMIQIDSTSISL